MKKLICGFAALLLSSTLVTAQTRIGITGGLQLINQPYQTPYHTFTGSDMTGFQAGLVSNTRLSTHWSIRSQLLYARKGGQYTLATQATIGPVVERIKRINYLDVPVQLVYGLKIGPGQATLGAGPYVGYALSMKDKVLIDGQGGFLDTEFGSESYQQKRLDYGLRVSVGYELPSGPGISLFYEPGFANINNDRLYKSKNTAYGLSLHYLLKAKDRVRSE